MRNISGIARMFKNNHKFLCRTRFDRIGWNEIWCWVRFDIRLQKINAVISNYEILEFSNF